MQKDDEQRTDAIAAGAMPQREPVELAPYSPEWPRLFAAECARLAAVFPAPLFRIEHIGSTAVPGLAAKPIIDVLVGAPALAAVEARIQAIAALGYAYRPEHEEVLPLRRFFVNPAQHPRRFHLHAVRLDSVFWAEHLLFRDALRANSSLAAEYLALKQALAARFRDDRERYTGAKAGFIQAVVRRAQAGAPFGAR